MEDGKGWKIYTRRDVRKLIDQGHIQEPEEYGFDDFRDMYDFIQARGDYRGQNRFKPSYADREHRNSDAPAGIDWDDISESLAIDDGEKR